MEVAVIAPTRYLPTLATYGGNSYHMALVQRVLEDSVYAEFYKDRSSLGENVIMDNGACEFGRAMPTKDLLNAVELISPSALVLPDVLGDAVATYEASKAFLKEAPSHLKNEMELIGVVQGSTKSDWMKSLRWNLDEFGIRYIGIAKTNAFLESDDKDFPRVRVVERLISDGLLDEVKIHILGLNSSGHMEVGRLAEIPNVEGVDTSAPIVHAYFDVKFEKDAPYIKVRKYLSGDTILSEKQILTAKHNIGIMRDYAKTS